MVVEETTGKNPDGTEAINSTGTAPVQTPSQPAPTPKKVEISEALLQDMMARIGKADALESIVKELQQKNAEIEKAMGDLPKPDAWYEQQKQLFESGQLKGKTVRLLRYGNKYVVGFKNYSNNPKLEILERFAPDPLNPDARVTYRTAILVDCDTLKVQTEEEVRFPKFFDECIEEICQVKEEKMKEEVYSEGTVKVTEFDEKHGYRMVETGETRELFVKVQKRSYLLATEKGDLLISERWINQK